MGEALENIAELTTCEPSQINPMVDCVTMMCAGADPLMAAGRMIEICGPLASALDSRCGDCLMAAISQDTLGLLSRVDGEAYPDPTDATPPQGSSASSAPAAAIAGAPSRVVRRAGPAHRCQVNDMTLELLVRYERAPDLELLKARVERCLERQLGLVSFPALSYAQGWTGEHAHEINVFLQAAADCRTWLLIGPAERLDEATEPAECWATVAATGTARSLLLTLATAGSLAELVGQPITDGAKLPQAARELPPQSLWNRLAPLCAGRSFEQAAESVAKLPDLPFELQRQ